MWRNDVLLILVPKPKGPKYFFAVESRDFIVRNPNSYDCMILYDLG